MDLFLRHNCIFTTHNTFTKRSENENETAYSHGTLELVEAYCLFKSATGYIENMPVLNV